MMKQKNNKYLKQLCEFQDGDSCKPDFMCIYEALVGFWFFPPMPQLFTDSIVCCMFPVLKGTKYAVTNEMNNNEAKFLAKLTSISHPLNHYPYKVEELIKILSKDLFTEHSFYLLKEHCKLFAPYNKYSRKLLLKLNELK